MINCTVRTEALPARLVSVLALVVALKLHIAATVTAWFAGRFGEHIRDTRGQETSVVHTRRGYRHVEEGAGWHTGEMTQ